MSVYKGASLLAGVATNTISNSNYLLDWKWSDHIINSMEWLRADTFSWQSGSVYTAVYNHLVADNSSGTSQTETVGSYTISYKLAPDGHKITTDESTVANIYNETGVAWYYVLDTTNQRFKLPRTKYNFVGFRDAVGKYVEAGLPNITGTYIGNSIFKGTSQDNTTATGAFERRTDLTSKNVNQSSLSGSTGVGIGFDASLSNSIYGNSLTVQPPATQMYLYFYVGQFSQSATEQTAGLNSSLFNGKLDLDMGNMNPSASSKATIVRWGVPDYDSGVAITSPYTPTKDGIITAQRTGGYSTAEIKITDGPVIVRHASADNGSSNNMVWAIVKAGVSYTITTGGSNHIFYPFIGA